MIYRSSLLAIIGITCLSFIISDCISQSKSSTPLPKVSYSSAFIKDEPFITVSAEGLVTVTVSTLKSCFSSEAFIGIFPDDAALRWPVYRKRGKAKITDSHNISFEFDIADLEHPGLDINNLVGKKGTHLALRMVLFGNRAYTLDRTFAIAKNPDGTFQKAPAIVQGPFVDCVTACSATISWEFNQPVACELILDPGNKVIRPEGVQRRYEIYISDLESSTFYGYTIRYPFDEISFTTPENKFRTAPPTGADDPFSFAVLSDCRATYGSGDYSVEGVNLNVLRSLLSESFRDSATLILLPGDLVSGYVSEPADLAREFQSLNRIMVPVGSKIPIYEGMGNHDLVSNYIQGNRYADYYPKSGDEASEVIFASHFVNPANGPAPASPDFPPYKENVYSLDWGNSHFTMLNHNYMQKGEGINVARQAGVTEGFLRDEQLIWLEHDLRDARQRGLRHLFVFLHEPAFPNGGHVEDAMWWSGEIPEISKMRDRFWSILCTHQVTAVFCGHEHNYSRALIDESVNPSFTTPIWQIVTGGGGASFYAQDKATPWAHTVKQFYPLTHYCLVKVEGNKVFLTVKTESGIIIENVELTDL